MPMFHARGLLAPLVAFALAVASAVPVAAGPTWTRIEEPRNAPSDRSAPAVAAVRDVIYLFGGARDDFATEVVDNLDDFYRFDPKREAFHEIERSGDWPPARVFASAAGSHWHNALYLFGGAELTSLFSFEPKADLWVYLVRTGTWREIDQEFGPGPRSGAALWARGRKLYLFGGIQALPDAPFFEALNDLWVFDIVDEIWTQIGMNGDPAAPSGRHVAAAGDHPAAGRLLLYGGEGFDPETFAFPILNDTWEYDLYHGRWREVTPRERRDIDPPRNYAASAQIGPFLLVHGGDIAGGEAGCGAPFEQNLTDGLWAFNPFRKRWLELEPAGDPLPRLKRHAAAALGDRMYVFSGWDFVCEDEDDPGQVWNRDVFELDLLAGHRHGPKRRHSTPFFGRHR